MVNMPASSLPASSNSDMVSSVSNSAGSSKATPGKIKHLRKHHSKSRNGCIACKARKIKCSEERPVCTACHLRKQDCCYSFSRPTTRLAATTTSFVPRGPSEDTLINVQDLRYFHYFLANVSHPLPIGNDSVWIKEIPQIARTHHFLLHAMLALGISEVARANRGHYASTEILKHRGQAIVGLQKALDDTAAWHSHGHIDAILGTLYILVYQASHMPDGAQDFETFVQGCAMTTVAIQGGHFRTAFTIDWPEDRLAEALEQTFPNILPESDLVFLQSGIQFLEDLRDAAAASTSYGFWHAQYHMCIELRDSPRQSHMSSYKSHSRWFLIAPGLLSALRQPGDSITLILAASFLASMTLCKVLIPLRLWPEAAKAAKGLPVRTLQQIGQWIEAIYQTVPECEQAKLTRPRIIVAMFPYDSSYAYDEAAIGDKTETLRDVSNRAHMFLCDVMRLGSELTNWFEETLLAKYHASKVER